jgi:hypothetical protein
VGRAWLPFLPQLTRQIVLDRQADRVVGEEFLDELLELGDPGLPREAAWGRLLSLPALLEQPPALVHASSDLVIPADDEELDQLAAWLWVIPPPPRTLSRPSDRDG